MAAAKEKGVFPAIESGAGRTPDPVADLISDYSAEHPGNQQPLERDHVGGRKNAGGDQQGITRKKKAYKKTGFYENDATDERGAARTNQFPESLGVVKRVEKVKDGIEHAVWFLAEDSWLQFLAGTGTRPRERAAAKAPTPIR